MYMKIYDVLYDQLHNGLVLMVEAFIEIVKQRSSAVDSMRK